MTTALNLTLLLISSIATLAAFGGRTWRDGEQRLIERISPRGWISLFCLTIALVLGATKEILVAKQNTLNKKQDALKAADAKLQLTETQSKLDLAKKDLENLQLRAQLTQDRLDDANTTLSDVRTSLSSTRTDLDQQSSASMVTALASVRADVSDMYFVVPPTSYGNDELNVRGQLLPELMNRDCDTTTQLDAIFSLGNETTETITYQPDDVEMNHLYSDHGLPKIDGLGAKGLFATSHFMDMLQQLLKQKSMNRFFYFADIRAHEHDVSIAQLYDTLARPDSEILRLVASWPNNHHYSSQCSDRIRSYFQNTFDKAALMLISDDPRGELFIFKLKARVERTEEGNWAVRFVSFDRPIVMAADPSMTATMNAAWKAAAQPDLRKARSIDATDSFHAWFPDVDIPPGPPESWSNLASLIESKRAQAELLKSPTSVVAQDKDLGRTRTTSTSVTFQGCSAHLITTFTNVDKNHKAIGASRADIAELPLSQISIGTTHLLDDSLGEMYMDLLSPVIETETQHDSTRISHSHKKSLLLPTSLSPAQSLKIVQDWYAAAVNCGAKPLPTVWQDESSALMWARKDNDQDIGWSAAGQYCKELELDGFTNWRLPTIDELHSMYFDKNYFNRKARIFTLGADFWSSTSGSSRDHAQVFGIMGGGGSEEASIDDMKGHRALCVRKIR
jgi:hypothetical protein